VAGSPSVIVMLLTLLRVRLPAMWQLAPEGVVTVTVDDFVPLTVPPVAYVPGLQPIVSPPRAALHAGPSHEQDLAGSYATGVAERVQLPAAPIQTLALIERFASAFAARFGAPAARGAQMTTQRNNATIAVRRALRLGRPNDLVEPFRSDDLRPFSRRMPAHL
jgi:hypothetical protein